MISVQEALALIEQHARTPGTERISLQEAAGRVLAQEVFADRDFPPFDRVMMDGIAIRWQDFEAGNRIFRIVSLQPAGRERQVLGEACGCVEVMTGAVLPLSSDTVIPYEDCRIEGSLVTVTGKLIRRNQHVHQAGTDARQGQWLIGRDHLITPAAVGVMASVGIEEPEVLALPRLAICGTGDELVAIGQIPLPHQIRRSNSYMLGAALRNEGIVADLYHLTDDPDSMQAELSLILDKYDALLCSGAVSKGRFDHLPAVLEGLGMKTVFHRIAQRPGKPMLFGIIDEGPVMFGFPGNPASTLVCYALYFRAWLRRSLRQPEPGIQARLARPVTFGSALSYHLAVRLSLSGGILIAEPCPGANSGDMTGLLEADAFITLPADRAQFEAGEIFPVTLLRPCLQA